jgi:hypothetical protein
VIAVARAQPLERGFLVAEGDQQGKRKLALIEGLKSKVGYGLFDLYDIHAVRATGLAARAIPAAHTTGRRERWPEKVREKMDGRVRADSSHAPCPRME